MTAKTPVAILISGRGSNMQALVGATRQKDFPAEIVLVLSNRPGAAGLEWAKANGVTTKMIDHTLFASREAFEAELHRAIEASGAKLVALAGFMRLMTAGFVEQWRDRMINIHPSLLPSFKGLNTHAQALAAGVKIAGCTVHFVRAELDAGPIIAQAAVNVLPRDNPATLGARVLQAEHRLYPKALRLVASGAVCVEGDKTLISNANQDTLELYSLR